VYASLLVILVCVTGSIIYSILTTGEERKQETVKDNERMK
jgi:hypothetical protein